MSHFNYLLKWATYRIIDGQPSIPCIGVCFTLLFVGDTAEFAAVLQYIVIVVVCCLLQDKCRVYLYLCTFTMNSIRNHTRSKQLLETIIGYRYFSYTDRIFRIFCFLCESVSLSDIHLNAWIACIIILSSSIDPSNQSLRRFFCVYPTQFLVYKLIRERLVCKKNLVVLATGVNMKTNFDCLKLHGSLDKEGFTSYAPLSMPFFLFLSLSFFIPCLLSSF